MSVNEKTKKAGKGLTDRNASELAAFFGVLPGHEDDLRAAVQRFGDRIRYAPMEETLHTGLRSTRHVIFDGGTRMMWATTFENDFDPYFDDAVLGVGIEFFINWLQHTTQGEAINDWYERNGGAAAFDQSRDDFEENARRALPELKAIITGQQEGGDEYVEVLSPWLMAEVIKGAALQEALDKVLEHPDAEEALSHPALAPLLEQAAS